MWCKGRLLSRRHAQPLQYMSFSQDDQLGTSLSDYAGPEAPPSRVAALNTIFLPAALTSLDFFHPRFGQFCFSVKPIVNQAVDSNYQGSLKMTHRDGFQIFRYAQASHDGQCACPTVRLRVHLHRHIDRLEKGKMTLTRHQNVEVDSCHLV